MSMLQSCIRKNGPLSVKIERLRAERIASGLITDDTPTPKKPVVVIKSVKIDNVIYPTMSEIQSATCEYFGVEKIDLLSHRRTPAIIRPRQVAVYLCRKLTLHSYPVIGRRFGRDHSTAIAAVRRIEMIMDTDIKFADQVNELMSVIKERAEAARRDSQP